MLVYALACCSGAAAQGKWDECNEIGAQSGPYKLLVTDVIQDESDARIRLLTDFRERLSAKVEELIAENSASNLHVILCPRSQPQENDFATPRIRSLNNQDVITVLWGRRSVKSIRLRYVVVPYRHEALLKGENRGLVMREIDIPDVATVAELLDLLSQNSVEAASAYFALGVGVRYLGAARYADAQRFLCLAKSRLGDRSKMGSVPKDIEAFLEQKLREVAKVVQSRGGAGFARQHPIEKCGAG